MANELVTVPFYGDSLEAVQDSSGQVWVSLRRCCDALGVTMQGQLEKLKQKPWCSIKEIVIHDAEGKSQPATVIDLDTLPGWLFSIHEMKVREDIRPKLVRFQREAAKVLADHFFHRRPAAPAGLTADEVRAIIRQEMGDAVPLRPTQPLPRTTIAERVRYKGYPETTPAQRAKIRRLANCLLDMRHGERPDVLYQVCIYSAHQIACLDDAIDRYFEEAKKKDAGGLFAVR